MTTAILDTNVLVQSLISGATSSSALVLDAFYDGHFQIVYSPSVLDEWLAVLMVPKIRGRHGLFRR